MPAELDLVRTQGVSDRARGAGDCERRVQDELIAAETKPTPDPSVEPIPEPIVDLIPPPNVAELLPDMPADSSVDDLLAVAEREIERRMAPKAEPEFESASYDSPGLLPCEKEWLARVLPGGLMPETSAQLTEAFYMVKAAKIPRGSPRYFQFRPSVVG